MNTKQDEASETEAVSSYIIGVGGGGDGAESAGSEAASTSPAAALFVESPQTPDGITGVKLTEEEKPKYGIHIDWLNTVFDFGKLDDVEKALCRRLGDCGARQGGLVGYRQSMGWEAGGMLAWSDGRDDCLASLNGDSLAGMDLAGQFELFRELYALGGRSSRIDVAFDDFTRKLFRIADVRDAANAGNFVGFRVFSDGSDKAVLKNGDIVRTSDAVTFGRKGKSGGGRQVIFYDKTLESGGLVNSLRIEARFMKKHAAVAGMVLASKDDCPQFQKILQELVGGVIDFLDRKGAHGHMSRMGRLGWWEPVVAEIGQARVTVERVDPPLQGTIDYFKDAYCKTFARLKRKLRDSGHDPNAVIHAVVHQMMNDGELRLISSEWGDDKDLTIDLERVLAPCARPPRRGRRR